MLTSGRCRFIGGGRFAPNKIAGLALWLKADAITGLSDGDAIGTWADSSGNGRNATQATAGAKPAYKTGIVNGQPVVRFDGGDVLANALAQLPLRTRSIFIVTQETGDAAYSGILVLNPAAGSDNSRTDGLTINVSDGAKQLRVEGSTPSAYTLDLTAGGLLPLGIYADIATAATGALYANGTLANTSPLFTEFDALSAGGYVLGGRFLSGAVDAGYRFLGDIAEIIVYDSALSDSNRQAIEAYLSAKYGIALA